MKRRRDGGVAQTRHQREVLADALKLFGVVADERRQTLHRHIDARDRVLGEIHRAEAAPAQLTHKLVLVDAPERGTTARSHRRCIIHRCLNHSTPPKRFLLRELPLHA